MTEQKIIHGDSLEKLKELPDNSVDAVVTDPPYGLSFMGKKWDYDVPSVELWKEVFRVMKPGAFLLSFAGTRTYHRMTVNIEDAEFEIRDMISWLYGSGFPKSLNIGKQIDKIKGNEREVIGEKIRGDVEKAKQNGNTFAVADANKNNKDIFGYGTETLTKGNSDWEGWGTALKPACEPIVVARKPLSEKNVALNCLKWGTGGINIGDCRIETKNKLARNNTGMKQSPMNTENGWNNNSMQGLNKGEPIGRFPANIILDEEAGKILDEQSGISNGSGKKYSGYENKFDNAMFDNGKGAKERTRVIQDKGGASRFFYCAKASKSERNLGCEELEEKQTTGGGGGIGDYLEDVNSSSGKFGSEKAPAKNNHPTVKPIKLMEYLIKLISKEGAVILDPFLGSGTTLLACQRLNRKGIGIEREEDYIKIAQARLNSQLSRFQNKN